MDRRDFLRMAAFASWSAVMPLPGWTATVSGAQTSKKLLVVFLRGAVDGLNVVAPVGDPQYYALRPTIAIAKPGQPGGAINLDGYFGLHPALAPLAPLWETKRLAFVHSCGSPDPTRSHFDAQDYMESGVPGVKAISTGWMNRLLSVLPENSSPIRAVNFGPTMPRIFSGPAAVADVSLNKNNRLLIDRPDVANLFSDMYARDPMLANAFQEGISTRRTVSKDMMESAASDAEQIAANKGALPPQAGFGRQLARLLLKETKTQVAFIAFGGWDTHVNQGSDKGQLASKLNVLAAGLADFYQQLGEAGKDVTTIVMSEFGRTAHENGNRGTDHGHGNVMWLLGGNVAGGKVYGRWEGLANAALYENRDLPVTSDFRSVVSAVLAGPFGLSGNAIVKVFPRFQANSHLQNILRS